MNLNGHVTGSVVSVQKKKKKKWLPNLDKKQHCTKSEI